MCLKSFRLVVLLLAIAPAIRAGESLVEVAPEVVGVWVTPATEWNGRAVLLFHGMASDRDDVGGLLKQLAGDLAAQGIASLRINFRGEGDARRTRIESTFVTRLEDAAAAHAWVKAQKGTDAGRMGALGFSLGGPTAVVTAARQPSWFKSIAVWSSPSGDLFALWDKSETAQRALREGEATEDIPGWKSLTTKRAFYDSFRGFDFDAALRQYPGAFLTIRGSADHVANRDTELVRILSDRPASALGSGAASRPAEAVLLGGADHIFNVFQPELGHAGRVRALTVAWFERTL